MKTGNAILFVAGSVLAVVCIPMPGIQGFIGSVFAGALIGGAFMWNFK